MNKIGPRRFLCKTIIIILILGIMLPSLTACKCRHKWIDATCMSPKTCSKCGEIEGEALGHDVVIDEGVSATLSEPGISEGSHCSRCGEILVEQNETPSKLEALIAEVKTNPDKVSNGIYSKVYIASDFAKTSDCRYIDWKSFDCLAVGIQYNSNNNTFVFSNSYYSDYLTNILMITIDGGIPANNYYYDFYNYNGFASSTIDIMGSFNASRLSSTSSFAISDYSAPSSISKAMLEVGSEDFKKDAADYAKQLIVFLDKLFEKKNLDIRSADFNFM